LLASWKYIRVVTHVDLSEGRNDIDLLSGNATHHEKRSCRQGRAKSQSAAPTRVVEEIIPTTRTGTIERSKATGNQTDIENETSRELCCFLAPWKSSPANSHNTSSRPNRTMFRSNTRRGLLAADAEDGVGREINSIELPNIFESMSPQHISVLCRRAAPVTFALWRSASLTLPFRPLRRAFGHLRADTSDWADNQLLARKSLSLRHRATRKTLSCGVKRVPDRGHEVGTCRGLDQAGVQSHRRERIQKSAGGNESNGHHEQH
jgi:hypothetical protein